MAYFFRLTLALLAFVSCAAFAATACYDYRYSYGPVTGPWAPDKSAAMAGYIAAANSAASANYACPPQSGKNSALETYEQEDPEAGTFKTRMATCSYMCTGQPATCSYAPGTPGAWSPSQTANLSQAIKDCPEPGACDSVKGMGTGQGSLDFNVGASSTSDMTGRMGQEGFGCFAGCTVKGTVQSGGVFGGSGVITMTGTTFTGGDSCNETVGGGGPGPTASSTATYAPPTPCGAGKCMGQVNGTNVCVPCDQNVSKTDSTYKGTSTTGSGTATGTTNSAGTTTTTVTCDRLTNICTTSTTKKDSSTGGGFNPDGTPMDTTPKVTSSAVVTTSTMSNYCADHPKDKACLSEDDSKSSFGGSCGASFTCDGDAVMCAIAKEQHARDCKFYEDRASAEWQAYDTGKGKTGSVTGDLTGNVSASLGPSNFDTSSAIGGGSCIGDKVVTVHGRSITIPFSNVCTHLVLLGNLLLSVSFLLAARIVIRG